MKSFIAWEKCLITDDFTLSDAMESINVSSMQTAIVVTSTRKLLGTLSDGDIRRAILNGAVLSDLASSFMCSNPHTITMASSESDIESIMRKYNIHYLPIVDSYNVVIGVHFYQDVYLSRPCYTNPVVIMAGGKGSRLGELTKSTPKPMLLLNNKPILEIILERFIEQGFINFWFAVNYLSDQIIDYFQDGSKYGVTINYLHEKVRSGTAGALSLLPIFSEPIIVSNADLITKFDFASMVEHHLTSGSVATMSVRQEEYTIPFGVVTVEDNQVTDIKEKPSYSFLVNAGMYVLGPYAVSLVPKDSFFDMPELISLLLLNSKIVTSFNVNDYWLDIGQPPQFDQALRDYSTHFNV